MKDNPLVNEQQELKAAFDKAFESNEFKNGYWDELSQYWKRDPKILVYIMRGIFSAGWNAKPRSTPDIEVAAKDFGKFLEEQTRVVYEEKITMYRYHDNLDGWGNYTLDDIFIVWKEKYYNG